MIPTTSDRDKTISVAKDDEDSEVVVNPRASISDIIDGSSNEKFLEVDNKPVHLASENEFGKPAFGDPSVTIDLSFSPTSLDRGSRLRAIHPGAVAVPGSIQNNSHPAIETQSLPHDIDTYENIDSSRLVSAELVTPQGDIEQGSSLSTDRTDVEASGISAIFVTAQPMSERDDSQHQLGLVDLWKSRKARKVMIFVCLVVVALIAGIVLALGRNNGDVAAPAINYSDGDGGGNVDNGNDDNGNDDDDFYYDDDAYPSTDSGS